MTVIRNSNADQVNDLIRFMFERLDKEEEVALAVPVGEGCVAPAHWAAGLGPLGDGWVTGTSEDINAHTPAAAAHIALHDPATELGDIAARRRIVEDYRISVAAVRRVAGENLNSPGLNAMRAGRDALGSCVRLLASRYLARPAAAALLASTADDVLAGGTVDG